MEPDSQSRRMQFAARGHRPATPTSASAGTLSGHRAVTVRVRRRNWGPVNVGRAGHGGSRLSSVARCPEHPPHWLTERSASAPRRLRVGPDPDLTMRMRESPPRRRLVPCAYKRTDDGLVLRDGQLLQMF